MSPQEGAWESRYAWTFEAVVRAGEVVLPDGRLAGGEAWWAFEAIPFEVQVPAGTYSVRLAIARAATEDPVLARNCAAAEVVVSPGEVVSAWSLVPVTAFGSAHRGYPVAFGSACFGPPQLLSRGGPELDPPRKVPWWFEYDTTVDSKSGDLGQAVAFSVGPQSQECLTFAGHAADGRLVTVLTDLGLLDLDPRRDRLPWY